MPTHIKGWSIVFKSADLPLALDIIQPAITNKTIWGNHFLLQINQGAIEGDDPVVTLIANNGLQEIRRRITVTDLEFDVVADNNIELCLPYDPFVRALDGATTHVQVVASEKTVYLTVPGANGPASHAEIKTIPNGPVYPEHPVDTKKLIRIARAGELYKAIGNAKVATSGLPSDTLRNAIHLSIDGETIVLEAADSYHAARVYGPEIVLMDEIPQLSINIPAQYISSLKNMAGEMWLAADENRVHVGSGKTHWTCVLVDGKWPDLRPHLAAEPSSLFKIKAANLRNRVRQASAFGNVTIATANVKYSRVALTLHPDDMILSISADTSVYGSFSATENVIEAHSDSETITIYMDAAVLQKALSGIDGEDVEVGVINDGRMISLCTEKEFHFMSTVLN